MKCPSCGCVFDDGCRFCGACGTPLEYEKKGTHRFPILILIVLSIVGSCVFFATGSADAPAEPYRDSQYTLEDGTLYAQYEFPGATAITVPETLGGQTVTAIGRYCFAECDDVSIITLPDTVERIGEFAFSGCDSLRAMELPGSVKSIGSDAFSGCRSLEAITIPASVTSMGEFTFSGCERLSFIFYDGTIDQWKALFPYELSPETAICCTDGNFSQAE